MSVHTPSPADADTDTGAVKIGYARVSSHEQNLHLQIKALTEAGCIKIYTDKASGKNDERAGLQEALDSLRTGTTLVVWKLDRLGRSIKNLIAISEMLEKRKIDLQSITEGVNTTSPMGKFYFHMMSALAQFERELIVERTKAGLQAAREQGRIGGRRYAITPEKKEKVELYLRDGMRVDVIAKNIGVSRATLYRYVSRRQTSDA